MENNNEYKCVKCSKVVLVDKVTCEKCVNNKRAIHNISKREYFAAMAMQGLLASSWQKVNPSSEFLGKMCTNAADNLIKALNE
jgi:hypothetical protein